MLQLLSRLVEFLNCAAPGYWCYFHCFQNNRRSEEQQIRCQLSKKDIPYFLPGFHAGDKWQQLGDFLLPRCRPCVPMPGEVGACEHACHVPVKTFSHYVGNSQDGVQDSIIMKGHASYQDQYSLSQGGILIQVPSMHVVDEKPGEKRCDLVRSGDWWSSQRSARPRWT